MGRGKIIQNAQEELNSFCKITWEELATSASIVQSSSIVLNALREETLPIQLPRTGRGRWSCGFQQTPEVLLRLGSVLCRSSIYQECVAALCSDLCFMQNVLSQSSGGQWGALSQPRDRPACVCKLGADFARKSVQAGNFPLLRSHRQEEEKEAVVLKEEMLILRGAGICVAARAWRA